MPKIAELEQFIDFDGDEDVVVDKGGVVGRGRIGGLVDRVVDLALAQVKVDFAASGQHEASILALRELVRAHVATAATRDASALHMALRALIASHAGQVANAAVDRALLAAAVRATDGLTAIPQSQIELEDLRWSIAGHALTIHPGRSAARTAGRAVYLGAVLDLVPAASGTVTDEALTIQFNGGTASYAFAGVDGRTTHARLTDVVVRDAATDAVLTRNVDYLLDAEFGGIQRATAGDPLPVKVNYGWSAIRYDLVEMDRHGELTIKAGTDRTRDVAEYVPTRSTSKRPVMVVRVTAAGIEAWPFEEEEAVLLSAPALIQRKRARRLTNFQAALRYGELTIAGYGDSRTHLGGSFGASNPYAANGPGRDAALYYNYFSGHGPDWKAAVPLYTSMDLFGVDDGLGAVHTRIGWNWVLADAVTAMTGIVPTYLNFGIAGTDSSETAPNGLFPARLAGLTSSGAHLAVIAFGMNELSTDSTDRLVQIGEACMAADIDPVFISPGRPTISVSDALDKYIVKARETQMAADYLGVPCIDTVALYGSARPGAMLLGPRESCSANGFNHETHHEFDLIGRALAAILLDT